jgi:hypothetical protein
VRFFDEGIRVAWQLCQEPDAGSVSDKRINRESCPQERTDLLNRVNR